jgi:hypothetical protein
MRPTDPKESPTKDFTAPKGLSCLSTEKVLFQHLGHKVLEQCAQSADNAGRFELQNPAVAV